MSARVRPADSGRWVAVCAKCPESFYGGIAKVDLWADVHNAEHHGEDEI